MIARPSRRSWLPLLLSAGLLFGSERAYGMMEEHFIFFPDRELVATPAVYGMAFEPVRFRAADGVRLHGWYLPGDPKQPLVLFCHGNAGNISHRLDNLRLMQRELGGAVFIFDYRGYGKSEGRATEEGLYADGRGALHWLRERGWTADRMIYFGRSLGAAVALQLALEAPPAGVVLESPIPSVAVMGRHHYPILFRLLGWMIDARFDNLARIGRLGVPLLLFHGERDTIVTEKMGRELFRRAGEPKTYHSIAGAGHNDTYIRGGAGYWEAWRRFIADLARARDQKTAAPQH